MKKKFAIFCILLVSILSSRIYAYHGVTHGGLTNQVEEQTNYIDNYLKSVGFSGGRGTSFTLNADQYWVPEGESGRFVGALSGGRDEIGEYYRAAEEANPYNFSSSGTTYTALDWVIIGSILEDVPLTRAQNHFHDPTTLQGLSDVLSGISARTWEFDDTTMDFRWSADEEHANVRLYQYKALTSKEKEEREHWWALTLFGVGSLMHLLEDMGVPEHVRDDFSRGIHV